MVTSVEELKALTETASGAFQPYHLLSKEADALTVYLKPDADYSKRLSDHVTLLLSLDDSQIVGCRIKGISGILKDLPNFIQVTHEGFQLSMVFLPFLGCIRDEQGRRDFNELARQVAEQKMMLPAEAAMSGLAR